jgi:hypothetical protein
MNIWNGENFLDTTAKRELRLIVTSERDLTGEKPRDLAKMDRGKC